MLAEREGQCYEVASVSSTFFGTVWVYITMISCNSVYDCLLFCNLVVVGHFSSEGPQNNTIIVVFWCISKHYKYSYAKHLQMNQLGTKVKALRHYRKGTKDEVGRSRIKSLRVRSLRWSKERTPLSSSCQIAQMYRV